VNPRSGCTRITMAKVKVNVRSPTRTAMQVKLLSPGSMKKNTKATPLKFPLLNVRLRKVGMQQEEEVEEVEDEVVAEVALATVAVVVVVVVVVSIVEVIVTEVVGVMATGAVPNVRTLISLDVKNVTDVESPVRMAVVIVVVVVVVAVVVEETVMIAMVAGVAVVTTKTVIDPIAEVNRTKHSSIQSYPSLIVAYVDCLIQKMSCVIVTLTSRGMFIT